MTIDERRQAIREAAEHELCETLGYWYDIKRLDIENAVGRLFGKLTENGAVLKTDEGHVGILIHRLSDDTEVPMTAFAPLIEK